jgi:hypothetical protein
MSGKFEPLPLLALKIESARISHLRTLLSFQEALTEDALELIQAEIRERLKGRKKEPKE